MQTVVQNSPKFDVKPVEQTIGSAMSRGHASPASRVPDSVLPFREWDEGKVVVLKP